MKNGIITMINTNHGHIKKSKNIQIHWGIQKHPNTSNVVYSTVLVEYWYQGLTICGDIDWG